MLAEQRHEDLRLLRPEPGQRRDPLEQLGTRPGGLPEAGGVAVVLVHDQPGHLLHPGGHRLRVAVHGRPFGEDRGQPVRGELGQLGRGGLVPQPPDQVQRSGEGLLERDLLVEQQSDDQGERTATQQLVGLRIHRHPDRHGALPVVGPRVGYDPQRTP